MVEQMNSCHCRIYDDDFEIDDELDQDDIVALKGGGGGDGLETSLNRSLTYFTGTGEDSDSDDGGGLFY